MGTSRITYHVMRILTNAPSAFTKVGDINATGLNGLKEVLIMNEGPGVYLAKAKGAAEGVAFKLDDPPPAPTGFVSTPFDLMSGRSLDGDLWIVWNPYTKEIAKHVTAVGDGLPTREAVAALLKKAHPDSSDMGGYEVRRRSEVE